MTEGDFWRGHMIEHDVNGVWCYVADHVPVADDPCRPCGACGLRNSPEGHDGCLGTLPGALNACCGHGRNQDAYVQLPTVTLRGVEAQRFVAEDRMPKAQTGKRSRIRILDTPLTSAWRLAS